MTVINFLYQHSPHLGYGRAGIETHHALTRAGVEVLDGMPLPGPSPLLIDASVTGIAEVVCWFCMPPHTLGRWGQQRNILFTEWETSSVPRAFYEYFKHFDQLLAPSTFCLELFSRYHNNVALVPHGVNPAVWHHVERQVGQYFDFLCPGRGRRKGSDIAQRAFFTAFPEGSWGDGPIPRLTLKSPGPSGQAVREDMTYGEPPLLIQLRGRLSDADEVDAYAQAHCLLAPSRGEGFGLQPLQAIAQGLPTILTQAHGHIDFAHLGIPLPASRIPVDDYFLAGTDVGDWWEPDLDLLIDIMRWVYYDYDAVKMEARKMGKRARTEHSWDKAVPPLLDAIGDSGRLAESDSGPWEPISEPLISVRCDHTFTADIGETRYHFVRDEPQDVPLDVHQVLGRAGVLA